MRMRRMSRCAALFLRAETAPMCVCVSVSVSARVCLRMHVQGPA